MKPNQNGIWKTIGSDDNYFSIFHIYNDVFSVKDISDFGYSLFSKTYILRRTSEYVFENDSLKAELDPNLEKLKFFKHDTLMSVDHIIRQKSFETKISQDSFLRRLTNKSLEIKMDTTTLYELDIFENQISFMTEETSSPYVNSFDIFELGNNIFFVPDVDVPQPIQIMNYSGNIIDCVIYFAEGTRNGQIITKKNQSDIGKIQGNWIVKNGKLKNRRLEIKQNQLMISKQFGTDTLEFEVLSDGEHIGIINGTRLKFKMKTKINHKGELQITDHRVRDGPNKTITYEKN